MVLLASSSLLLMARRSSPYLRRQKPYRYLRLGGYYEHAALPKNVPVGRGRHQVAQQ
ncbi:hypothetical protein PF005_g1799 [Phytophthora fragariae]|uniref:Uncharacterized protein n=1 Tax=Phytophthora fragariae TaxID=53985 RepID=A0A6A3USX2_9STRA|nr:hypothetical protein PF009_g1926 [Phytophthora fragariae]KAE9154715.1 hypothetical protein PF006_g1259 [Phytophthora fragariae]KAE9234625.1 hypothetical protein PF005_g1799 [Phytophthora fragariae]KAE9254467.1 hypothetical protein PF004_g1024 [Phytophthora fragariae]KAE9254468.1 hypothetical protein PF004_g1023 [Phytophthora fragariae]